MWVKGPLLSGMYSRFYTGRRRIVRNVNIRWTVLYNWDYYAIQLNPSGKAWNISLNLWNVVQLHAPSFTNHVYFTPRDRPPLLKGHYLGWSSLKGSTVYGFMCLYIFLYIDKLLLNKRIFSCSWPRVEFLQHYSYPRWYICRLRHQQRLSFWCQLCRPLWH